jgi:peptide-methionine (S)-S-oxide reductase
MSRLDNQFREAVGAIDSGDELLLGRLIESRPELVAARLEAPGEWLCGGVGHAIEKGGFFERPYLLWFVAEDPVRRGKLPPNISVLARRIIDTARREKVESLPEQLDYALRLVCWSWIARQCGVQIELIEVMVDAGATLDGLATYQGRFGTHTDAAIYNGNFGAAEHLMKRGASLTLTTALCLNRWEDAERLAAVASLGARQDAFVQAALNGNAEALRMMLALGMDPTTVSERNQSHATALHHAVWSGQIEAVRVLVEAGANLARVDEIHGGTPLGWAEYGGKQNSDEGRAAKYREIAEYLRPRMGS